ncbi:MAG: asparagine synthase (glutamine-hydrolyzing) [Nitrospira sp.]|nr:asparagine synthase (glutamine-hydrolyzing) [Nitrospira sp.]
MCGIAGVVGREIEKEFRKQVVRKMIAMQKHRGPDGEGFFDSSEASLGHCRLAIIDLGQTGHQPMSDCSGRYWITYNGEIYNYIELADELRGLGCYFEGHSDTEVLLNAYCQWGPDCVLRLRGMFAFAIWDRKEKTLFAARDRLGIKPFHYYLKGDELLAFSSELKALIPLILKPKVNLALARDFIAWNLLDHNESETLVEEIRRLPPAHTLLWNIGGKPQMERYWAPSFNEEIVTNPLERNSLIDEFHSRFNKSIAIHLRADVPVGTCLSGGLDSSAIVCAISEEMKKWDRNADQNLLHTFSAYFDEPHLDERIYIEEVIAKTGCTPHFVKPQGDQLREDLDRWLWHMDEPVGGLGAYVQYCVFRLSQQNGIKVLLDGQGADEQLAGYRKFILVFLRQLFREKRYLKVVSESLAFFFSLELLRTTRFVDGRRYLLEASSDLAKLWPHGIVPPSPTAMGLKDSLGRRLLADQTHFSLPVLLRYEDRNSMAFGVESRVPFLDHPLVEFLGNLPADMKLGGGWTKRILRDALLGVLPEKVRTRKSKLGFSAPETKWLAGPLEKLLNDRLRNPEYLMEVVDCESVRKLLEQRVRGDRSLSLQNILFRLAIYESWAKIFLNNSIVH